MEIDANILRRYERSKKSPHLLPNSLTSKNPDPSNPAPVTLLWTISPPDIYVRIAPSHPSASSDPSLPSSPARPLISSPILMPRRFRPRRPPAQGYAPLISGSLSPELFWRADKGRRVYSASAGGGQEQHRELTTTGLSPLGISPARRRILSASARRKAAPGPCFGRYERQRAGHELCVTNGGILCADFRLPLRGESVRSLTLRCGWSGS